jgi:superfamily I DNA and/or RNA helicase
VGKLLDKGWKLIVGLATDPNQLPPTVISTVATKFGYSESMFVRIQQRAPHNVHLLRFAAAFAT